jgi:hypothetical protein
MKRLAVILALLYLAGCGTRYDPSTLTKSIVLSKGLQRGAKLWRAEANRHDVDPVVLVCHGNTLSGKWMLFPDEGDPIPVEGAAQILKQVFPHRPLLLLVCNPGHHALKTPGVYYAKESMWMVPDRASLFRIGVKDVLVGRFDEMVWSGGE